MSVLAHLLQTVVYSYNAAGGYWIACFPNSIDKTIHEDVYVKSMYIQLTGNCGHFCTKEINMVCFSLHCLFVLSRSLMINTIIHMT